MLTILVSIAPIFVLIVLGYALRRGGIPSLEFWNLNDRLVYWVLMPALLFSKMSTVSFSLQLVSNYAFVILTGFGAAVLFSMWCYRLFKLDAPVASSLLQGAARHNTFIALAVAETLFGAPGLALASLITALLIPATNITVVTLMVQMLRKDSDKNVVLEITRDLMRNPLLLAVLAGISFNALGWNQVPVLHKTCDILGAAALPIVLLCVGANIRVRAMTASLLPIVLSMIGKMLIFPVVIFLVAQGLSMSPTETLVALLFGAVPTAASGYTLARQMGGDAPLMAAMVTLQTAVSFITMPMTVLWVQSVL